MYLNKKGPNRWGLAIGLILYFSTIGQALDIVTQRGFKLSEKEHQIQFELRNPWNEMVFVQVYIEPSSEVSEFIIDPDQLTLAPYKSEIIDIHWVGSQRIEGLKNYTLIVERLNLTFKNPSNELGGLMLNLSELKKITRNISVLP